MREFKQKKAVKVASVFDGISYDVSEKAREMFEAGLLLTRLGEPRDLSDEARQKALARLGELDEEEKHCLLWAPTRDWEAERLLLLAEVDYKTRLNIEAMAAHHAEQQGIVNAVLFRLREVLKVGDDPVANVPATLKVFLMELDKRLAELDEQSGFISKLQISKDHQEMRNDGKIIEKRKSVADIALDKGLASNTISGYLTQIRNADAHLPEAQRRIKTAPRGRYDYAEQVALEEFMSTKQKRPSRRKSRLVA
jgi:hypothetical protein